MIIQNFRDSVVDRYRTAQEEKEKGKPIIGWTCGYVPEEIVYAAGMFPWRLLGKSGEITVADAYLYTSCCSFVKSCFEDGITGNVDFLDGYVTGNTCDFIRRLYDVWRAYLEEKTPIVRMLSIPFKKTESALNLYKQELIRFKKDIEIFFDIKITDESLRDTIKIYNETRILLKRLYNLRKIHPAPISGADIMDVVLAAMVTERNKYNQMLKDLLLELEGCESVYSDRIRLMILGSELGDSEFIRIIEDLGGIIVIDDLCTGRRYFWDLVDEDEDPIEGLAKRYLLSAYCPRMSPYTDRVKLLQELCDEFNVEGVIFETIQFCEAHGVRFPLYKQKFKELGLPVLKLGREHGLSGVGQMKTRVQAFFESIGG